MSNFLKSFSSIGKSQERHPNQPKSSSKGPMKKLFQKKNNSSIIENSQNQQNQSHVLATQIDEIQKDQKLLINFNLPQGQDSRNAANTGIYGVNSHQAIGQQNSMAIQANLNHPQKMPSKRGGSFVQNMMGNSHTENENEKIKQENLGLRQKIQELQEEKMQLKNNLKVNKEVITNLMEKQATSTQLQKDSFRDHSVLLTENFDYNQMSSMREKVNQDSVKKRPSSIKDKIIQQQIQINSGVTKNSVSKNVKGQNAQIQVSEVKYQSQIQQQPVVKQGKLPVPQLNLSTLKHVQEYTKHDQVFLNDEKIAGEKPKIQQIPNKPAQTDIDNQWYHYSTQLELNVKELRTQIDDLSQKLDICQEKLSEEVNQKDKLQQLNLKLTKIVKQQKLSQPRANANQMMNMNQPNMKQYNTGAQLQFNQNAVGSRLNTEMGPQSSSNGIQIQNLNNLYTSNQYYIDSNQQLKQQYLQQVPQQNVPVQIQQSRQLNTQQDEMPHFDEQAEVEVKVIFNEKIPQHPPKVIKPKDIKYKEAIVPTYMSSYQTSYQTSKFQSKQQSPKGQKKKQNLVVKKPQQKDKLDMMMRDDDSGGSPIVLNETVNETDEESENNGEEFKQSIEFSDMLYRGPMQEEGSSIANTDEKAVKNMPNQVFKKNSNHPGLQLGNYSQQ